MPAGRKQKTTSGSFVELLNFLFEVRQSLTQFGDLSIFGFESLIDFFSPVIHPCAPASSRLPQCCLPVEACGLCIKSRKDFIAHAVQFPPQSATVRDSCSLRILSLNNLMLQVARVFACQLKLSSTQ
jgi:hypothetical protein